METGKHECVQRSQLDQNGAEWVRKCSSPPKTVECSLRSSECRYPTAASSLRLEHAAECTRSLARCNQGNGASHQPPPQALSLAKLAHRS